MIGAKIKDGSGRGYYAQVTEEGAFGVVVHPHPPRGEGIATVPFARFFTSDGTATGSNNMVVNGATTPIDFYIASRSDFDFWVNRLSVQISDAGARLDRFGALNALANGIQFFYYSDTTGEVLLTSEWKTNLDVFRDASGGKAFGTSTDAWLVDIAGGTGLDTYFPEIDFSEVFGNPWGVRIAKESKDRLGFRVRDNLAGLDIFNIKGYGILF